MKKILETKNIKQAFTLIEIIIALTIAAMASMYILKSISQNDFNNDVVKFQAALKNIIDDGILSEVGYASGADGNCSSDYDFTNLTTQRLVDCLDWNKTIYSNANGFTSRDLMGNYNNCFFDTQVAVGNSRQFDFYVDCSNVDFNDRSPAYLEDATQFVLEQEFQDIHIKTFPDAVGTTSTTGGTDSDGKIRVLFEL
jgi:prepilin-type N-terminal cleavage/methylation domain-containing protein